MENVKNEIILIVKKIEWEKSFKMHKILKFIYKCEKMLIIREYEF